MPRPPVPVLALAVLLAAGLLLAGCGQPAAVVPAEATGVEGRLADLETEIRTLRDQRDAARLGAKVSEHEAEDLRRTIGELMERVQGLEERPAMVAAGASPRPEGEPGVPLPLPTTFEPGADGSYSESQVGWFRGLMDEVERRRTQEAQAERVRREFARAGVSLTADEEKAILQIHQAYQTKMRDVFRNGFGTTDAERAAAVAQRDALRTQYEQEVRAAVPSSQADKIVESLKRGWPGFFPRRADNRPRGGGDTDR